MLIFYLCHKYHVSFSCLSFFFSFLSLTFITVISLSILHGFNAFLFTYCSSFFLFLCQSARLKGTGILGIFQCFIITTKLILYPVLNQWLILSVLLTTHTWKISWFWNCHFFFLIYTYLKKHFTIFKDRGHDENILSFFFFLPRELSMFTSYRRCLENTCRHKIRMMVMKIKILLLALCSI